MFSSSIEGWAEGLTFWATLLGVIAAGIAFLALGVSNKAGKMKDAENERQKRDFDLRISEANKIAALANEGQANANERAKVLEKGTAELQRDAVAARLELEILKEKQRDRKFSQSQRELFIKYLSKAHKRPTRVIVFNGNSEAITFARQVRLCLDAAGFSDPLNNEPETMNGPIAWNDENTPTMVAYFSQAESTADFDSAIGFCNVPNALRISGIPCALISGSGIIGAGQMAVFIGNK
jgi:hypothetical protein